MCVLSRENRAMVRSSFVTLSHCPLCQLHRCNSIADTAEKKKEERKKERFRLRENRTIRYLNMRSFWSATGHWISTLRSAVIALFFPIKPRAVHVSRTVFRIVAGKNSWCEIFHVNTTICVEFPPKMANGEKNMNLSPLDI